MIRLALAVMPAAIVLSACGLVGLAQPAADDFTRWSRVPLPPDPRLTAKAETACGDGMQPRLPILVQDRRTPLSAIVLFGDDAEYALCWSSHGGGGAFASGGSTIVDPAARLTIGVGGTSAGTSDISHANGEVALPATRVVVRLEDGSAVEASVGGGRWVAWWPGQVQAVEAVAYGPDGAELARAEALRQP